MVETPLSPWCSLLLLALPGIYWLARTVAVRACNDRAVRRVLIPGLAVALWLVPVHAAAYVYESFALGLWTGTLVPALLGLLALAHGWREPRAICEPHEGPGGGGEKWMWITAAISSACIAPLALGFAFHDEVHILGHLSMTNQMLNDVYPPRYINFPEFELRYHYGFNTLCAMVSALLRVGVDASIDVVTLLSWFYTWCVLWVLGGKLSGSRAGGMAAPLVLLGGGVPLLCGAAPEGCSWCTGVSFCTVEQAYINPPIVSYFFQHPWTLGLPLGALVIAVYTQRRGMPNPWRHFVMGWLLVALSFSQVTLFVSLLGAWVGAEIVGGRFALGRHVAWMLGTVMAAVATASLLGSWFAPGFATQSMFVVDPGIAGGFVGSVRWLLASHGLLIALGLAGLACLPSAADRWLLGFLMLGSVVVVSLFDHRFTWDIVKFSTVTQLSLALASAALLCRLAHGVRSSARVGRLAAALLGACVLAGGVAFPFSFLLASDELPADLFARRGVELSPADRAAAGWLRHRVLPGEVVYRGPYSTGLGYAQWAGLPQVWMDKRTPVFGLPERRLVLRKVLLTQLPASIAPYIAERVRWLVLGPADVKLRGHVAQWQENGMAAEVARFEDLRVIKLMPSAETPRSDELAGSTPNRW